MDSFQHSSMVVVLKLLCTAQIPSALHSNSSASQVPQAKQQFCCQALQVVYSSFVLRTATKLSCHSFSTNLKTAIYSHVSKFLSVCSSSALDFVGSVLKHTSPVTLGATTLLGGLTFVFAVIGQVLFQLSNCYPCLLLKVYVADTLR